MISEYNGSFYLVCDVHGDAAEEKFDTFQDAVDFKNNEGRRLGWKSQKRNGEWEDVCPECQE